MVSIIIVTWNSQKVLEGCVDSLFLHVPIHSFELILVDNGSEDLAYLKIFHKDPNVKVVFNGENLGFAKAVNIGLAYASGDYFLVLNPDIIFISNPLPRLLEELDKDKQIGVIGPLLYNDAGLPQIKDYYPTFPSAGKYVVFHSILAVFPPFQKLAMRFYHARIGSSGVHFVDQIPGAFFLFHKNLFGKTPALNEAYFIWMEDVDFCLRIHQKGLKVAVVADEKIIHIGGTSFKMWETSRRRLMFTRSYLTYLSLHFNLGAYFLHIGLMLLNSIGIMCLVPLYLAPRGFSEIRSRLRLEFKVVLMTIKDLILRLKNHSAHVRA